MYKNYFFLPWALFGLLGLVVEAKLVVQHSEDNSLSGSASFTNAVAPFNSLISAGSTADHANSTGLYNRINPPLNEQRQKQAPCSTTPAGGTTISDRTNLCIGSPFALSVNNATSDVTGLTYQWQSSIDSAGWTDVAGEINASFNNVAGIKGSTYYRRKISCGTLSSSSSPVLVSVNVQPAFAQLPFSENFETPWQSLCSSSRGLPSNYWRNEPITGANSWRKDDEGSSAGWISPNNGGWGQGADGTPHAASFHSSQSPVNLSGDLSLYLDCSTGLSTKELTYYCIPADSLKVSLSVDGGSSFTTMEALGPSSREWSLHKLGFISSSAKTVIKFSAKRSKVTYSDVQIDEVSVATVPCITPSALVVKPLLQGANYSFKPSAVSRPDGFEYAVTTSGVPPASGTFTSDTIGTLTGLSASTNYFMHVRSVCTSTGNSTWTSQSFQTATANCAIAFENFCQYITAYRISDFEIKGENGTVIRKSGIPCTATSYLDFTASSDVMLAKGKSYSCMAYTDTVTALYAWIDYNDDSAFTYDEKVIHNFAGKSKGNNIINLNIPLNARVGSHRLRITMDGSSPCGVYPGPGHAQDYTVTIVEASAASPYLVSPGIANTCVEGGSLTINEASNNTTSWIPLTDTNNNIIASINANGNNLNRVGVSEYVNAGMLRTAAEGKPYLDRNVQISVETQPATYASIRLYILQSEFDSLKASDPSIHNWSDLSVTKTSQLCSGVISSGMLLQPVNSGPVANGFFVEYNIPGFSSFFLHNSSSTLPVKLRNFEVQKKEKVNRISWTTVTELNNAGFEIEKSTDGTSFEKIAFVLSKAVQGNSASAILYNYDDPHTDDQDAYYRLKQADRDGQISYSNTVHVRRGNAEKLSVKSVFPNPAGDVLNINLASERMDNIRIMISEVSSSVLISSKHEVGKSDNLIKVNVAGLRRGTYFIKIISETTGEQVNSKFLKL